MLAANAPTHGDGSRPLGGGHGGLDLGLEITRGADRRERHVEVELFPFSTDGMREWLRSSGFTHVSIDATNDDDRYTAVARAGDGAAASRS